MIRFFSKHLQRFFAFLIFVGGFEYWHPPHPVITLDDNIVFTNPFMCPPIIKKSINTTNPTGQLALPIVEDCQEAAAISWDFIDKIIYINAKQAIDRNEAMRRDFLPVFKKNSDDVIRFEAFSDASMRHPQRVAKSHMGALQLAFEKGFNNVLILEDDVLWRVSPNRTNLFLLRDLITKPYDVILFGGTSVVDEPNHRVSFSQTTSSYLVFGEYIPTLLNNFHEGLDFFSHQNEDVYIIDLWWQKLMKQDLWYILRPALVIQIKYPQAFGYFGINGT